MSRLVTIGEAARELGVSPKTLRRYEASGLLKPIRTMGGQRRYYLASLRDLLASAEDKPEPIPETERHKSTPPLQPPSREPSVWDAVEEEKASFEALKIRAQREVFLRERQEDEDRIQRERQALVENHRREAALSVERQQSEAARQREASAHSANVRLQQMLSELHVGLEPKEAHGPIRRALLQLLTLDNIPLGTPAHRIQQLVQDEIDRIAAPFRRVRDLRARGLKSAEHQLDRLKLDYFERQRLREIVESELSARVSADWSTRRVERLVDSVLDEFLSDEDDDE